MKKKKDDPWRQILVSKGRILPLIEMAALKENHARNDLRDTDHLHASEMAKKDWCPRNSWYRMKRYPTPPEDLRMGSLNVFAEGHSIHDKWQKWMWDSGILKGDFQCKVCGHRWFDKAPRICPKCRGIALRYKEVPIYNAQYQIIGHADGQIEDAQGDALIEIKSVGLGTVRVEAPDLHKRYESGELKHDQVWREIKKPFPTHLRQANIYMFATGIHTMIFIYEWKANQQVKEFIVRFQPSVISDILAKAGTVMRGLETGIPPMRPIWIEKSDNRVCNACPYKSVCWKEDVDEDDQAGAVRPDAGAARDEVRWVAKTPRGTIRRGPRPAPRSRRPDRQPADA